MIEKEAENVKNTNIKTKHKSGNTLVFLCWDTLDIVKPKHIKIVQ